MPQVDPPFAIAEEPVYRHGASPGDYAFQGINVGRLFPDVSAVVSDQEPVVAFEREINRALYPHLPDSRIEDNTRQAMGWYRAMIGQPLPLFGIPFADADGNIWLPSYRLAYPDEGSPYTVVSPEGQR